MIQANRVWWRRRVAGSYLYRTRAGVISIRWRHLSLFDVTTRLQIGGYLDRTRVQPVGGQAALPTQIVRESGTIPAHAALHRSRDLAATRGV